jgi:chromosome partitioning protein
MREMRALMHIVVVASQKGGTGKTTACSNLAVAAGRGRTDRVAVIDADDQASLSDWVRDRGRNSEARTGSIRLLPLSRAGGVSAAIDLARGKGVEWLFVDTEPSTKSSASVFLEVADLVIVPIRPSLPDVRSAGVTIGLCEQLHKRILAVLTMAKPRTVALREFTSRVRERAPCADSVFYDRQAYPLAFALGLGVVESDPHDTGAHVRSLLGEVEEALRLEAHGGRAA